ncbi:uncharacterized protein CC84DRAFT_1164310 [Paraphaeosphaeria sporulosa]|uniref:Uncharacterized protein n=1 Tax=Paraphaeosphaeria sporulosa TaxID=1460663 RepID=A0A177CFZ9_9PLEO|nr:uncharacterized protein CC84DRAFT_1164310 [Paraphaeosphaeria sporulosa]OAG05882.1 hypothetical protein CC84DRAFT_1164310 [Paraphaeosphaeria sporulosa]
MGTHTDQAADRNSLRSRTGKCFLPTTSKLLQGAQDAEVELLSGPQCLCDSNPSKQECLLDFDRHRRWALRFGRLGIRDYSVGSDCGVLAPLERVQAEVGSAHQRPQDVMGCHAIKNFDLADYCTSLLSHASSTVRYRKHCQNSQSQFPSAPEPHHLGSERMQQAHVSAKQYNVYTTSR